MINKITDLYAVHVKLMKYQTTSNKKDLQNQKGYSEKLDLLFDRSHAASEQLTRIEEDKQFLKVKKR